jgi:dihydrofolate reductase
VRADRQQFCTTLATQKQSVPCRPIDPRLHRISVFFVSFAMPPRIALIYAQSRNGIIGNNGGLPWRLPSDLKRFKAVTMGKPIIMGRKTWDSLPRKPLPGRPNIILTRQKDFKPEGAIVVATVEAALLAADGVDEACVIGGAEIYNAFMPHADRIYLTEINLDVEGDTKAPQLRIDKWEEVKREHYSASDGDDADFTLRVLDKKHLNSNI